MMVGKTSVCDDIPSACTNGRDEKYGREFIATLDDSVSTYNYMAQTV
jgi:hypothetical protein